MREIMRELARICAWWLLVLVALDTLYLLDAYKDLMGGIRLETGKEVFWRAPLNGFWLYLWYKMK